MRNWPHCCLSCLLLAPASALVSQSRPIKFSWHRDSQYLLLSLQVPDCSETNSYNATELTKSKMERLYGKRKCAEILTSFSARVCFLSAAPKCDFKLDRWTYCFRGWPSLLLISTTQGSPPPPHPPSSSFPSCRVSTFLLSVNR